MARETVGKLATDLIKQEPATRDPIELQREIYKDYEKNLYESVNRGKKQYTTDFFVLVLTKKERLLQNVLRNYFFPRGTCPTPEYDQTVYKYYRGDDRLEFLWVIPSKDTCQLFRENALEIADAERELLDFILRFYDGSLLAYAKQLNNEKTDSILLEQ